MRLIILLSSTMVPEAAVNELLAALMSGITRQAWQTGVSDSRWSYFEIFGPGVLLVWINMVAFSISPDNKQGKALSVRATPCSMAIR